MTVQLAVTFATFLVEYKYLFALYQFSLHFANHLCAFYYRSTYSDVAIVVNQKNFVKLYCCTGFCALDVVYKQLLASFCFKLLTVNFSTTARIPGTTAVTLSTETAPLEPRRRIPLGSQTQSAPLIRSPSNRTSN